MTWNCQGSGGARHKARHKASVDGARFDRALEAVSGHGRAPTSGLWGVSGDGGPELALPISSGTSPTELAGSVRPTGADQS